MAVVCSIIIGYLLGCISPAALVSKIKNKDLRKSGTGNLGATNTLLVFGKSWGVCVMLFDVAKAFTACKLARWLFPSLPIAGMLAGSAAVAGHIYPFYMKFRGGKGLASFAGLILGVDPLLFPILLICSLTAMFIVNFTYAIPMTAAPLFPVLYYIRSADMAGTLILAAVGVLIVCVHISNIHRARRGDDAKMREFVKDYLLRKIQS